MEDAYDSDKYGHESYTCATRMIMERKQYEKSIPYLWCLEEHCSNCPGETCPTRNQGFKSKETCRSACLTLLGFAQRKKTPPDFDSAEKYYKTAIREWPQNCGALGYLTEYYLQTKNISWASKTLDTVCDRCSNDPTLVNTTLNYFSKHGYEVPMLDSCGTREKRQKDDPKVAHKGPWVLIGGCVAGILALGATGFYGYKTVTNQHRSAKVSTTNMNVVSHKGNLPGRAVVSPRSKRGGAYLVG